MRFRKFYKCRVLTLIRICRCTSYRIKTADRSVRRLLTTKPVPDRCFRPVFLIFDCYPNFRAANDRFSAFRSFYEVNRVKVIWQSIETSEKDKTLV